MSQDASTITLSSVCYNPGDEKAVSPEAIKPKVESHPFTTSIRDMSTTKSIPSSVTSPKSSRFPTPSSSRPSSSEGSSSRFPLHEITQMNKELVDARQKGEMPRTKASPLDEDALTEDYASLLQLREVRGDMRHPPTEEYTKARVDIARRIKERDDRSDKESQDREAQRRIHDYLYSAKKEDFILSESNSPRTPPNSAVFPPDSAERLVERLSKTVNQASQYFDATEPFLDTLDHYDNSFAEHSHDMRAVHKGMKAVYNGMNTVNSDMNEVYNNMNAVQHDMKEAQNQLQENLYHTAANQCYQQYLQQHFHQAMSNQQNVLNYHLGSAYALTSQLNSLMEPQATAMQASTENLALMAGITTQLSEQLRVMPSVLHQTVQQTVQEEVRAATRHIMEAQQEAMLSLLGPRPPQQSPPKTQIGCDSKRSLLVSKVKGLFQAQACS
jgi:hypothetical protein